MTDYEYFRAPDVSSVLEQLRASEYEATDFVGVELKGIDPSVVLGQFVAFAMNQEYDGEQFAWDGFVWPENWDSDRGRDGPWVTTLEDGVRDVLAGIPADRVPELAERWAEIEEFYGDCPPDELREVAAELIELAADARAAGESLFCRISL